jgi:long-subunit fatty acid transport protein
MRVRSALLGLLAFFAAATGAAQTIQLFDEYGVGPRDSAMGGAYAGVADDFAAAFYNAAGLTQQEDVHVTLGWKMIHPDVRLKIAGYADDHFTGDYPDTHLALLGFNTDLYFPRFYDNPVLKRFHLGMAFAISPFVHSYTNYWDTAVPYFFRYNDRPIALLSLYLAGAVRIFDWMSVGGGIVVSPSTTHMDCRVETHVYLPEGEFVSYQGIVSRSYSTVSPQAGVLFRIPIAGVPDRLRIGVVWHDKVVVIDGNGHAVNRLIVEFPDGSSLEPIPPMDVPVKSLTGFNPMKVTLGVSARPYRGGVVTVDGIWQQWSQWINYFYERPDPRFRDTWTVRAGFEHTLHPPWEWLPSVALRLGGYYQPTPVPSQNGRYNLLDSDTMVYTGGLGFTIGRVLGILKTPVTLDLAAQVHDLAPRTIANDQDPKFPRLKIDGMIVTGAASIGIEF